MPAGTWHFVLDSIIIAPVDTTFELIWRRGATDTVLTSWMVHWDPLPEGFDAQPYAVDRDAQAIDFAPGDKLVFRYSAANTIEFDSYIPNGHGESYGGQIPNITLPK